MCILLHKLDLYVSEAKALVNTTRAIKRIQTATQNKFKGKFGCTYWGLRLDGWMARKIDKMFNIIKGVYQNIAIPQSSSCYVSSSTKSNLS